MPRISWPALLALIIALLGVGLVFPLAPWAATIAALKWAPGWPLAPWLVGGCLALAAALLPRVPRLRPVWPTGRAIALGMGVLCLLQPLLHSALLWWAGEYFTSTTVELVWPAALSQRPWSAWIALLIGLVIIPALAEEWFFRGRLLPWLGKALGSASAISLTTLWFAAVHGNPLTMVVAIPLGLALALLYQASGSLYACILVHAAHNLLLLSLGGLLVARPDLALLFFAGGAWLVLSALPAGWLNRQWPLRLGAVILLVVLAHGAYRWVHQGLWLRAAERQLLSAKIPAQVLLPRLQAAHGYRLLTPQRRAALLSALQQQAAPRSSEWWWRAAIIDTAGSVSLAAQRPDGLYELLRHLASHAQPLSALQQAAASAAAADPLAFAAFAAEDPAALPLLLPLADHQDLLVEILRSLEPRQRAQLLSACRLAWDRDRSAALHLLLPASAIGPRDRYYMHRHHPQAQQLIDGLRRNDDQRYQAWMQGLAIPPRLDLENLTQPAE